MNQISKSLNFKLLQLPDFQYEDIFRFIFLLIAGMCLILIRGVFSFREYALQNHISVIPYDDFKMIPLAMLAIHGLKLIVNSLFYDYIQDNLNSKYIGQFRSQRVLKILKWIYDGFYYSATSICGYYLFKDEPWFPTGLGGSNFSGVWQEYPQLFWNYYASLYYMIQTASHCYALADLIWYGQKKELKYWEYMLHHSLATCLLLFSAMYNCVRIGTVVLMIHDVSDIILSWGRAHNDISGANKYIIYTQYGLLQLTWVYLRLWIFPSVIYEAIQSIGHFGLHWQHVRLGYIYMVIQMITLLCMHCYWEYQIIQTGLAVSKAGGKYANHYDNRELKHDD